VALAARVVDSAHSRGPPGEGRNRTGCAHECCDAQPGWRQVAVSVVSLRRASISATRSGPSAANGASFRSCVRS
jgi:hypothetical protein